MTGRRAETPVVADRLGEQHTESPARIADLQARVEARVGPDAARPASLKQAEDAFLAWLGHERRASALTVEAYGRDLAGFFRFLTKHLGGEPGLATLICYQLVAIPGGTRVTVRHEGFGDRTAACDSHAQGWERVLEWLETHVARRAA